MEDGRAEGSSEIGMEGKLQCCSYLTLMVQVLVPYWNQMHICIFESLQLEGSCVGDLLYLMWGPG